jgi:Flp pilus assembly pilin Flp
VFEDVRQSNKDGAQALVEYVLILSFVAIVSVASLAAVGGKVTTILTSVAGGL